MIDEGRIVGFFNAIPKKMKGIVISKSPEYTAAKTPCNEENFDFHKTAQSSTNR
jgi:hypothetical protein